MLLEAVVVVVVVLGLPVRTVDIAELRLAGGLGAVYNIKH